jgi:hypothetical protein
MKIFKNWLSVLAITAVAYHTNAHIPMGSHGKPNENVTTTPKANFRTECAVSKSQRDLEVNNVRARLQGGGDLWWDFSDGRYIVPKVAPGVTPVSSIFAGGIWIGGVDAGGNLKTACTTFRTSGNDWYPGPLDAATGSTGAQTCADWDKHFRVTGAEIKEFRTIYAQAKDQGLVDANGRVTDPGFIDLVPRGIKGWPSIGNSYFAEVWGFQLTSKADYLAYFWDNNNDGVYDPMTGDFPSIYVRGCEDAPQNADEMIFWVYNDEGGGAAHTNSKGQAIRMEVQAQAFAYATNDELNNMSFIHYRLINRASEAIDSMFFAMWVDADLGCYQDDYVGCDTTKGPNGKPRNLMYMYNQDDADGNPGTTCPGGVATYGTNIPIVGVDYFRGPLDPRKLPVGKIPTKEDYDKAEIGMSSFMYYNNGGVGTPPPATTDPTQVIDFYRYLNAIWKDGTPLTGGGSGYNPSDPTAKPTKYAFPGDPDDGKGWSMVNANLPYGDRRTIQASGPFPLNPGAINELIVGVPWVPNQGGGKVSLLDIRTADDIAQDLFDRCFRLEDGPDAPDLDVIELENELVLVLTNNSTSNNYKELYGLSNKLPNRQERPAGWVFNPNRPSEFYEFEGYKIYQLAGPTVTYSKSLVDQGSDLIKLVAQVDVKNRVKNIFNWSSLPDPFNTSLPAYYPVLQVEAADAGIRHTFKVTQDLFAKSDDKSLVNHKKYYFVAVAYGHNNFLDFDKNGGSGQKRPYIEGRLNVKSYIGIPRPIVDRNQKADYGDGAIVTRLDGVGIGSNFVDIADETRNAILDKTFKGEITYKAGRGPIAVNIYNPLEVKDGEYELVITDNTPADDKIDANATWKLKKIGETQEVVSDKTIERLNEQVVAKYGFSIAIAQTKDAGSDPNIEANNGMLGGELEYADSGKPLWFRGISDGILPQFDFVTNQNLEDLGTNDPNQRLSTAFLDGQFIPYCAAAYKPRTSSGVVLPFASPGWHNSKNGSFYGSIRRNLANINNVNLVFTSDKSKWSRCMVVESNNTMYQSDGLLPKGYSTQSELNNTNMGLRRDASVGSDTNPDAPSDGTIGKSWFPGYAIDVETGRRLMVFFAENSAYDLNNTQGIQDIYNFSQTPTGGDMIWNPTADLVALLRTNANPNQELNPGNLVAGCGHYIYVTDLNYDDWKKAYDALVANPTAQQNFVKNIRWTAMPIPAQGTRLLSYQDGLIPNDVTIKLRVDNPYQVALDAAKGTGVNNSYPTYRFTIKGKQASDLATSSEKASALDAIKVIPNPYYAYSAYEVNQFSNIVKIANLPAKCVVTIYTLDGKFIRQYRRDETPGRPTSSSPGVNNYQVTPAIEWDLKNAKGIPVASGTYIIHIASDLGEKTIKWFGVLRPFDPSGL